MLHGSKVINNHLNEKFVDSAVQIQVLYLGFGDLERVPKNKFNAEVLSVEKDRELEDFGETHFSSSIADEWEGLNLIYKFDAGDVIVALGGIEATNQSIDLIESCDPYKSRTYDLVFVDMIDLDIYPMVGACAPPRGFINDLVFNNIKHLLHQQGALVIHVIAPDCFFEMDLKNILENHFLMI
ncbi:hypothetical protein HanRHA438_Chr14g0671961 [Helianthus annuus]|uniref:S-adenosyl-L-methionine-dependent methyltransferase n=1 Tax=Helianthus annuus TaxID=4232 RepID=A0A9K3EDI2_HELAN|nr:hypothetical protein HanXRQr2_Chr14g0660881 [Helianthus annuus]KAJ0465462.1 hypothetical protein HanHA300_Chr14g0538471 [Helianthus annuus]KAJ0487059.1 hypothetical protein HanHA89_Chr14g0586281 [Helianthus annuus]KAJ0661182.1 hypothetical protein HanOQP8_Chr14g0545771 [Helianthus annuus]KAJ0841767.1 hypothetical protein HanPSC8_Chr14g0634101 [Helianthus annuus]